MEGANSWIRWLSLLPVFATKLVEAGSTVKAELQPGDALVYDSRLLHRGLGKRTNSPCSACWNPPAPSGRCPADATEELLYNAILTVLVV